MGQSWVSTGPWPGGGADWGSSGGVPPYSFCRPDRVAPGEGGVTTDGWVRQSIRTFGRLCGTDGHCLPCLRFMRVGIKGTESLVQRRPGHLEHSGLSL